MQGFFFDQSLSNLQRYVEDPSSFLVLWSSPLFFFSSVFSPLLFFPFFLLLIPFWRWYLCHFCFLLSTFTWWYFSEKVCNVALSSYWSSFVWFYTNESFRDKRRKWFSCQSFSKSVSVVHDHNIDAVFSIFTRGEIATFKSFCLTKGFFWFGINRSYVTADNISQCIYMAKTAICFAPHII